MGLRSPVVGVLYLGNLAALRPWLPDDVACLNHVNRWRWTESLRHTQCGREKGRAASRGPATPRPWGETARSHGGPLGASRGEGP